MKRAAIILFVCVAGLIATRMIVDRLREDFSGVGFEAPSFQTESPVPVRQQTVVTSLPPLTNLTIRPQRTASENFVIAVAPVKTNEIKPVISQQKKSGKPPRQDLLARVALASVGIDPVAEQYWVMAINDPSL